MCICQINFSSSYRANLTGAARALGAVKDFAVLERNIKGPSIAATSISTDSASRDKVSWLPVLHFNLDKCQRYITLMNKNRTATASRDDYRNRCVIGATMHSMRQHCLENISAWMICRMKATSQWVCLAILILHWTIIGIHLGLVLGFVVGGGTLPPVVNPCSLVVFGGIGGMEIPYNCISTASNTHQRLVINVQCHTCPAPLKTSQATVRLLVCQESSSHYFLTLNLLQVQHHPV